MMGANSTQAQGVSLFLVAFVCISAGLAGDINYLWLVLGLVLLGVSAGIFMKAKSLEEKEG
jgi:hypothetical protein